MKSTTTEIPFLTTSIQGEDVKSLTNKAAVPTANVAMTARA